MFTPTVINVVQLAVQEVGLSDRSHLHLCPEPVCTSACHLLLLQSIGKTETFVFNFEGLLVSFLWIKVRYESGFTKEEAEAFDAIKLAGERLVCIDREIGRDDGQRTPRGKLFDQEIGNSPTLVIVTKAVCKLCPGASHLSVSPEIVVQSLLESTEWRTLSRAGTANKLSPLQIGKALRGRMQTQS